MQTRKVCREVEDFSLEDCRNTLNKLLYVFDVAGLTKMQLISAINDGNFTDLEDPMQCIRSFREPQ